MYLQRCSGEDGHRAGEVAHSHRVRERGHSLTVDLHCHSFVPEVEQLVKDRPEKRAEPDLQRRFMGEP